MEGGRSSSRLTWERSGFTPEGRRRGADLRRLLRLGDLRSRVLRVLQGGRGARFHPGRAHGAGRRAAAEHLRREPEHRAHPRPLAHHRGRAAGLGARRGAPGRRTSTSRSSARARPSCRARRSSSSANRTDPCQARGNPSSSAPISSRSRRVAARAITSDSSRTLPGHGSDRRAWRLVAAAGDRSATRRWSMPAARASAAP